MAQTRVQKTRTTASQRLARTRAYETMDSTTETILADAYAASRRARRLLARLEKEAS